MARSKHSASDPGCREHPAVLPHSAPHWCPRSRHNITHTPHLQPLSSYTVITRYPNPPFTPPPPQPLADNLNSNSLQIIDLVPLPRRPLLGSAGGRAPRLDEEPVGVLHHCIRGSARRDPFICATVALWPVIGHFEDRVRLLIVSDFAAD